MKSEDGCAIAPPDGGINQVINVITLSTDARSFGACGMSDLHVTVAVSLNENQRAERRLAYAIVESRH
mgnify:CR=1 FL=1